MPDYRAKKGDSLWSIAEANKPAGVSTGEYWTKLKAANAGVKLFSGTKVRLPGAPTVGTATTRNADVAEKIASRNLAAGQKDAVERRSRTGSHFRQKDAPAPDAAERGSRTGSHFRKPDVKMDAVERGVQKPGSHYRKPDVKMDAVERGSRTGSHFRQKDK